MSLRSTVAQSDRTARMQDRLNATRCKLVGGCNINCDVAELLKSGGFETDDLVRFALPGYPKFIGSHFVGSATLH